MALRSVRERVLQTLCYEAGGLCIASPIYAALAGGTAEASVSLMASLSLVMMLWCPLHNTVFDWIDFRLTGKVASDRGQCLRILQAVSFEMSALVVTLPLIMWIGSHGFLEALGVDIGLTLLYAGYGYLFHIIYDDLRPVDRNTKRHQQGLSRVPRVDCD